MRIAPTQPVVQKREPIDEPKYRKHVSQQPCRACGWSLANEIGTITQAAHISVGNFARGKKANDDLLIPLCVKCHDHFDGRSGIYTGQEHFARDELGFADAFEPIDELKAEAQMNYREWKDKQHA